LIKNRFKTTFANNIFHQKYAQGQNDSWDSLCVRLVDDVCGSRGGTLSCLMSKDDMGQLVQYMQEMKFLAGGRYLYYAGREFKAYNNCFLLRSEEDTREDWANTVWKAMSCLSTGGGIGNDYSRLRPRGAPLKRTGGTASGPIPLMRAVNEIGREVMQGGSRRSAIYASLNWQHGDINEFLISKNWDEQTRKLKAENFNYPAPLDMTNISVNYDDAALGGYRMVSGEIVENELADNPVFKQNVRQAMETGEPGFSFNFLDKQNETLRNALTH